LILLFDLELAEERIWSNSKEVENDR